MFSLTVPSTKEQIQFRQFTVREEKALLQAEMSDDMRTMTNAVKETVLACTKGLKDVDSLTLFDLEFLITRIRAKSVGEKIDLNMKCDADETHPLIPVRVDLEGIEVTFPEGHDKKIHLYEDVGVVMRYPNLKNSHEFDDIDNFDAVVKCIESIYTDDEVFYAEDQTEAELKEFVESLTEAQLEKIKETFFDKMPSYQHVMKYTCKTCGHEHEKILKGLSSFFG